MPAGDEENRGGAETDPPEKRFPLPDSSRDFGKALASGDRID